jgi:hypothetical protein
LSDSFPVQNGLKQGDISVVEAIIKNISNNCNLTAKGNISNKAISEYLFDILKPCFLTLDMHWL